MSKKLNFSTPGQKDTAIIYHSKNDLFKIIKPLGKGGTSTVYSARSQNHEKEVAIKVFDNLDKDKAQKICVDELLFTQGIDHPNIVSTIDAGFDHDSHFIVMQLINGIELEELLIKHKMTGDFFIQFATQILQSLILIHSKKILHLDIKPINIMVSELIDNSWLYRLIDFGAAKKISDQHYDRTVGKRGLEGSIHFMSPEQINQEILDERSDIYSLGCSFYQALTQKRPFEGENAVHVMASHIQNTHTPLSQICDSVSPGVIFLIERMINAKREDRPNSAQEILEAISVL